VRFVGLGEKSLRPRFPGFCDFTRIVDGYGAAAPVNEIAHSLYRYFAIERYEVMQGAPAGDSPLEWGAVKPALSVEPRGKAFPP